MKSFELVVASQLVTTIYSVHGSYLSILVNPIYTNAQIYENLTKSINKILHRDCLVFGSGENLANPMPYQVKTLDDGVHVSFSNKVKLCLWKINIILYIYISVSCHSRGSHTLQFIATPHPTIIHHHTTPYNLDICCNFIPFMVHPHQPCWINYHIQDIHINHVG